MRYSGFETQRQTLRSPLIPPSATHKKTLVLDLDETLVHSTLHQNSNSDLTLYALKHGKQIAAFSVFFRPHAVTFLQNAGRLFELVIFTASRKAYADLIIDKLDAQKSVGFRLYREHCTPTPRGYVKNLTILGRPLSEVIMVDNLPVSCERNKGNAIPIETWVGRRDDNSLERVFELLKELVLVDDVRKYLRSAWKPGVYDYERVAKGIRAAVIEREQVISNIKPRVYHKDKNSLAGEKENVSENYKPQLSGHKGEVENMKRVSTMLKLENKKIKNRAPINLLRHCATETSTNIAAPKSLSSGKYFLKRDLLIRRGRLLIDKDRYIFESLNSSPASVREHNRCSLPPI